jgi:predicted NBD/HSP70 family sugar kinase
MTELPPETANSRASVKTIGVTVGRRISAGLIVDHSLSGPLLRFPAGPLPEDGEVDDSLVELPTDAIITAICELVVAAAKGNETSIHAVGIALPGLVRNGVVGDAPNLPQLKGVAMQEKLEKGLARHGITARVSLLNEADSMAAGLASRYGKLDSFIRVWTLGTGIGFGIYPFRDGVWEGGHTTVTLDDKENYCGCGGRGHIEGIMGQRAMRLRFLDMEPEEVFAAANRRDHPDPRCLEFKRLWHRALAAGTATSIHYAGAGKFFITGYNARFVDLAMFKQYLHEMVKMSPLQGYSAEVVEDDHLTRIVGVAVAAEQMAGR